MKTMSEIKRTTAIEGARLLEAESLNALATPNLVRRWIWDSDSFVPVNGANWATARFTLGAVHDVSDSPAATISEHQVRFTGSAGARGELDAGRIHARTEFGFGEDNPGTVALTLRNDIAEGVVNAHVQSLIVVTETKDENADGKMVPLEVVVVNRGLDAGPCEFSAPNIKKGISANSVGPVPSFASYFVGGESGSLWHHGLAIAAGKVGTSVFVHQGRTMLTAGANPMLSFGHDKPKFNIDARLPDAPFTQRSFRTSQGEGRAGDPIKIETFRAMNGDIAQVDYAQQVVDVGSAAPGAESGRVRWDVRGNGTTKPMLIINGDKIGVFGSLGNTQQTITGSTNDNPALKNLIAALASYGAVVDQTT